MVDREKIIRHFASYLPRFVFIILLPGRIMGND